MQKIRKILRAVSEKTALPTNQPTNPPINYYQQHLFYRPWLTPVQKEIHPCIAKFREQIITSEHITRFNVISFEEDQFK